jgi:chemotaxis signal transduction protein
MIAAPELPHLTFELGLANGATADFALDVAQVAQVLEASVPTLVPLAPDVVRGIINHHGRIVTAVDPAMLLGLPRQAASVGQVILLRREGSRKANLGLVVGRVREIVPKAQLERVEVRAGPCISWVAKLKRRLIHVVSLEPLLDGLGQQFSPRERGEPLGVEL